MIQSFASHYGVELDEQHHNRVTDESILRVTTVWDWIWGAVEEWEGAVSWPVLCQVALQALMVVRELSCDGPMSS